MVDALASFSAYDEGAVALADAINATEQPDCLDDAGNGPQIASAALARVADGWGAVRKGPRVMNIMPFLERGISMGPPDYG